MDHLVSMPADECVYDRGALSPIRVESGRAKQLAALALQALLDEAELTPKPALVDRRGNGAHHDLSLALMRHSAVALASYFEKVAALAATHALDVELRELLGAAGREAERAMLQATCGVNTHRGAIWAMGLLVAAAARGCGSELELCRVAAELAALPDGAAASAETHGQVALRRYGAAGAKGEAVAGFPHVRELGSPALRAARARGVCEEHARVDALLAIMSSLCDTCLLHRGGEAALAAAQQGASAVLAAGGVARQAGRAAFAELEATLMRLWASPGGSADLLAATLFVDALFPQAKGARS